MIDQELNSLMYDHSAAKAKMSRGISLLIGSYVLLFVGYLFYFIGIYASPLLIFAILAFLASIPLSIFGLISLITGIIGRAKANAAIARLKNAAE